MKETKHTPGPWEATHFCKEDGTPIETVEDVIETMGASARKSGSPVLYGVTTEGADYLNICYTGNGPKGLQNAHLIAATPELVKALEVVTDSLEAEIEARYPPEIKEHPAMMSRYERDMEEVLGVRAIISKARGEQS